MDQYKTSEDLEIYEFDYRNSSHLQEACDVRQPVLFQINNIVPRFFKELSISNIAKYGSHDIQLKNTNDYYVKNACLDPLPLPLHQTIKLIEGDSNGQYFSENNREFLEETGLYKAFQTMDSYIKPDFSIDSKYDLITGSLNTSTPLRYHTYYRQYLCVLSGKIHIQMAPWKNVKYLHPIRDYEYYEFRSPIHPLNPNTKYKPDYDKVNFLHFDVSVGQCVYLPPYWWYSIRFIEQNTFVSGTSYTTIMNAVANLPDLAFYWLQQQNITKKIKPPVDKPVISPPVDGLDVKDSPEPTSLSPHESEALQSNSTVEIPSHEHSDTEPFMENVQESV